MSFSEKMRESLGAEGLRLELPPPSAPLAAGQPYASEITFHAGSRPARVARIFVRIIEAHRYWKDASGEVIPEEDAQQRPDRRSLEAVWDRRTLQTSTIEVDRDIAAHSSSILPLEIDLPLDCLPSTLSCCHALSVQAAVPGQIDPSTLVRILVSPSVEPF